MQRRWMEARVSIRARQLANGTTVYDCCVDIAPDPLTGKRRQERKTLPTRKEARDYERRRRTEVKDGTAVGRSRLTVEAYLEQWLTEVIEPAREITTATHYRWLAEKRINPFLGSIPLADLTTSRIQRWVLTLSTSGGRDGGALGRRSVEAAYRILHTALHTAVRQRLLTRNPAADVILPKVERGLQRETWTIEQARRFLAVAGQDAYEPFWTLALLSGLRRAELLGLRWRDIDWEAGTATIRTTMPLAGSTRVEKKPKNRTSRRPVPLSAAVIVLLKAHRTQQALHKEECQEAYTDHDLICATPYGHPWYPTTVTHRFVKLAALAGVPSMNLHYARHTYASIALANGESLAAVSEVLGHASRRTTAEIYLHVEQRQRQGVADTVSGLLMSHSAGDVTSNVTSKDAPGTPEIGAPLMEMVRPEGLEPPTLRSGIWCEPLPVPLGTKRRGPNRPKQHTGAPCKTEGDRAG